jgi:hypothetical protein
MSYKILISEQNVLTLCTQVDVTSKDIVCNVGGTSGAGVKTIEAKAGDKITVQWDQSTHPGPITHMLHGPVASAEAATGVSSPLGYSHLVKRIE